MVHVPVQEACVEGIARAGGVEHLGRKAAHLPAPSTARAEHAVGTALDHDEGLRVRCR